MIEHVYRRSLLVRDVDEIVMAVCEEEVLKACETFAKTTIMTSIRHQTATDRVAEAARILGYVNNNDIVINVQGDEPVVPPDVINRTRDLVASTNGAPCANMVETVKDPSDLTNHHRVKAVISQKNRLIYLTRQSIPATVFDIRKSAVFYRQTCVMAFRGDFLQHYFQLERTPLELIEGIDMLRIIENDYPIASGISPYTTQSVDIPEDVAKVVDMLRTDPWFKK